MYAFSLFEGDIIDRGIREHPELGIGMTTEGIEVRSVGNTLTLHESALVEAFNLKAAIQFEKNDSKLKICTNKILCMILKLFQLIVREKQ